MSSVFTGLSLTQHTVDVALGFVSPGYWDTLRVIWVKSGYKHTLSNIPVLNH